MGEHLPEGRPLATAGDEYPFGTGVSDHRGVNQGFMVDKLIPFAGLNLTIQDQTSAKAARFDNLDRLKLCPAGIGYLFDAIRLHHVRGNIVMKPLIFLHDSPGEFKIPLFSFRIEWSLD
ncbi:hypothetical protein ES703_107134 [subsurface metagenome]